MSAQPTPAPGWYPDPHDSTQGRYWNGSSWTAATHVPGQPLPPTPPQQAPPGTEGNTVWVWLIILLPLIPLLLLLFVPWGSMFDFDPRDSDPRAATAATFGVILSPFYWGAVVLGYVVYGLSVVFAYRDVKELAARGIPKPFHWAFAFIGGVVYTVGRAIVVTRRTGRGHAPLWAEIGVVLLSIGVVVWIVAVVMVSMFDFIDTVR